MIQVSRCRHDLADRALGVAVLGQVVHEQRRQQRGDDDERDVDADHERGGGRRRTTASTSRPTSCTTGDAEVAAAGVDAERPALEPRREVGVDVGHRRGEVAAADAGEQRRRPAACEARRPARARRRCRRVGRSSSSARDDRPVPAAERRRPRRCRASAGPTPTRVGMAVSRNFSGAVEAVGRAQEQHEHRPQAPHREADVLATARRR